MVTAAIIAEFHPFHNGHAHLIERVRAQLGADCAVVCVMSGNYVQRGTPALLDRECRTRAALGCGADLLLELPVTVSLRSAEGFAHGAVSLLKAAGCVTHLVFGSESGDAAALSRVADCLSSDAYRAALKDALKSGRSFAACRQSAALSLLGEAYAPFFTSPNDNLAVEYLKALRRCRWDVVPLAVRRAGARHDGDVCHDGGAYASGSAVRAMLERGDWEEVSRAVPPAALAQYRAAFDAGRAPVTAQSAERLMLVRLRTMGEEDFARLPDCGEGLQHRFYRAVQTERSCADILAAVKTKRYPYARLRRMMLCAWLGLDAVSVSRPPAYLRPLGMTARGRAVLARMRKTALLPVLTKSAHIRRLDAAAQRQFALQCRTEELYRLLAPDWERAAPGGEWRRAPIIIP